jgi:hypothetical protein
MWEDPRPSAPPPRQRRVLGKDWWRRQWERLRSLFRHPVPDEVRMPEPEYSLKMPELLDVTEPSDEFTIETPAMGDAFNFQVRVRCSWHIQATAHEAEKERKTTQVLQFIDTSRPITRQRIEERVRPIARKYPPYRAAEAEAELNRELVDCLGGGDVLVKVRTWVDVSEPVREDLRKVWRERLIVDAVGDRELAHVELLGILQKAWKDLLVTGLEEMGALKEPKTGWMAPYALALAEDPTHAAGYLKGMLEKRVEHAEQLLADLGTLAIDDRAEAIEFAFQSESALRRLLMYLGVPVPEAITASSHNGAGSNGAGSNGAGSNGAGSGSHGGTHA